MPQTRFYPQEDLMQRDIGGSKEAGKDTKNTKDAGDKTSLPVQPGHTSDVLRQQMAETAERNTNQGAEAGHMPLEWGQQHPITKTPEYKQAMDDLLRQTEPLGVLAQEENAGQNKVRWEPNTYKEDGTNEESKS
jgi:hypothetical protein